MFVFVHHFALFFYSDQLSTISIHTDEEVLQENEAISDNNNNDITIIQNNKSKTTKSIKHLTRGVTKWWAQPPH
jgi:hypothetical protein